MTTPQPVPTSQIAASNKMSGGDVIALLVIASCQLMVVLDITIVNIALPHIQSSLDFSTTSLSWVVNAYTLTFGGLLLLGGRSGRHPRSTQGLHVRSAAVRTRLVARRPRPRTPVSCWASRALQGVGGAIASPTALALITTTFTEGPKRNRAFGVFAAVSAGGAAIGLLAGGILVEWLDWRWVFFVNVPIALLIALATPRHIKESERHPGHFDLAGAFTSTLGMVALVYGFIRAAQEGWRDPWTIASFCAAVVLLTSFILIERRSKQPITPLHMFADRNRSGTYGIMLSIAAAIFGMFFFLTLFVQNVLDFSPLQAGLAFLPVSAVVAVGAGFASQLLPKYGPKPFMVTGSILCAVGLSWLTLTDINSTYLGSILGPIVVFGFGMGLNFVSLTLMAVSGVGHARDGRGVRHAQRHPAGGRFAGSVHPGHGVRHGQPQRGRRPGAELPRPGDPGGEAAIPAHRPASTALQRRDPHLGSLRRVRRGRHLHRRRGRDRRPGHPGPPLRPGTPPGRCHSRPALTRPPSGPHPRPGAGRAHARTCDARGRGAHKT